MPLVWWVDLQRRTVAVYQDGVLGEGDDLDGDVLPGFRVAVAEVFAEG